VYILALFYYEYLITISEEIRFVWGNKITGVTMLFLLNRYISLLYLHQGIHLEKIWPFQALSWVEEVQYVS
ncbi:hypothetical protein B0H21DRAFT_697501, partial [Amylocystis lapponica]